MPIVTPEKCRAMLNSARAGKYALPAINVTSSSTGNKKVHDPRSHMRKAESGMASRVVEAAEMLKSIGKTMGQ